MDQKSSVSSYAKESRNIVIAIPNIGENAKLDNFCACLKAMVRLEILKIGPMSLEKAVGIAVNVDSVLHGTEIFRNPHLFKPGSEPLPTDIDNVENIPHSLRKVYRNFANGQRRIP